MTPAKKLLIVVAVQFLVMLSVLGFKQYTVWTAETIVLKASSIDPSTLTEHGRGQISYEISDLDTRELAGEDQQWLYVEVTQGDDGYWHAAALQDRRQHSVDGSVLIKGQIRGGGYRTFRVAYGIEDLYVPDDAADGLPGGTNHELGVEVRVDRYGEATPLRLIVDRVGFDLSRR